MLLVRTTGALRGVPVAMVMLVMALVSVTPTTTLGAPPDTADVVYGQAGSFTTNTENTGGRQFHHQHREQGRGQRR